jgi:hypothetical protein
MHYVNQKLRNFPFFGSVSFPRKLQLDTVELEKISAYFRNWEKSIRLKI